jgi:UDP-N-acetylmuramate dehydrogenase
MAAGAGLIARLPRVKGPYQEGAAIKDLTWFRAGGPAEVLYIPPDADDLAAFLKELPEDVPVTVIGVGSNLLVRDGGVSGVVIRLGRGS